MKKGVWLVILAAGEGKRARSGTGMIPKSLYPLTESDLEEIPEITPGANQPSKPISPSISDRIRRSVLYSVLMNSLCLDVEGIIVVGGFKFNLLRKGLALIKSVVKEGSAGEKESGAARYRSITSKVGLDKVKLLDANPLWKAGPLFSFLSIFFQIDGERMEIKRRRIPDLAIGDEDVFLVFSADTLFSPYFMRFLNDFIGKININDIQGPLFFLTPLASGNRNETVDILSGEGPERAADIDNYSDKLDHLTSANYSKFVRLDAIPDIFLSRNGPVKIFEIMENISRDSDYALNMPFSPSIMPLDGNLGRSEDGLGNMFYGINPLVLIRHKAVDGWKKFVDDLLHGGFFSIDYENGKNAGKIRYDGPKTVISAIQDDLKGGLPVFAVIYDPKSDISSNIPTFADFDKISDFHKIKKLQDINLVNGCQ